jgi:hypothetical protein
MIMLTFIVLLLPHLCNRVWRVYKVPCILFLFRFFTGRIRCRFPNFEFVFNMVLGAIALQISIQRSTCIPEDCSEVSTGRVGLFFSGSGARKKDHWEYWIAKLSDDQFLCSHLCGMEADDGIYIHCVRRY